MNLGEVCALRRALESVSLVETTALWSLCRAVLHYPRLVSCDNNVTDRATWSNEDQNTRKLSNSIKHHKSTQPATAGRAFWDSERSKQNDLSRKEKTQLSDKMREMCQIDGGAEMA